jgi:hypothetical protein
MDNSRKSGNKNTRSAVTRITLADGKEYEIAPLDLNMLIEIEAKFGGSPFDKLKDGKLSTARYIFYLRLRDKNPAITEEQVGKLVTWRILAGIFGQLTGGR